MTFNGLIHPEMGQVGDRYKTVSFKRLRRASVRDAVLMVVMTEVDFPGKSGTSDLSISEISRMALKPRYKVAAEFERLIEIGYLRRYQSSWALTEKFYGMP